MNQQSAQGLAALGRGPDSMLVHMAPGEVKSLQQLAMAHGGSLTINPETGLPEAGFLSSILPMVLGAGAMMIPGLQGLGAAGIGLGLGGFEALRTGSLKKGLMAGLGAYGGAGLGSALAGAGGANMAAAGGVNAANIAGPAVPPIEAFNPSNVAASAGQKMLAGAQGLGSEAGRNAFMSQIGGSKGLMQAGLAAASPMLMETTTKQPEIKTDKDMGQRYRFDAGALTPTPVADTPGYNNQGLNFGKERQYFNPMYRPIDNDAARKLYGFASGGPVEDMSNANAIGMNTGYPQANIETGAYATPYQQPISRNVVTGPQGAGIDPYTGQQQRIAPAPQAQFAEGGAVDSYTYDPVMQMYVKKSGEGATIASPTGGASMASGEGTTGISSNPEWENMTPTEKAEFYQDPANSLLAGITQLGQKGIANTSLGLALNALVPGFQNMHSEIAKGHTPQQTFRGSELNNQAAVDDAFHQANNIAAGQTVSAEAEAAAGAGGISNPSDTGYGTYAHGGLAALARGGISHLGDYSDGGRLLRGPGDGISDSIPAMIGKKQPARLADGEFVVPARIVSELGNGSTEAGARKLYAMMDRVQKARKKTVGKGKVAANSRSAKYLPA